jgi:hypothetical protein
LPNDNIHNNFPTETYTQQRNLQDVPNRTPSSKPSLKVTPNPVAVVTSKPSSSPSSVLTSKTTVKPTAVWTSYPTVAVKPSLITTSKPTSSPSQVLTSKTTVKPTAVWTSYPTVYPTKTNTPSQKPNNLASTYYPTVTPYSFSYPICAKTKGALVNYKNKNNSSMCLTYNSVKAALDNVVTSIGSDQSKLADLYGAAVRLVFHDAVDLDLTKPDLMGGDGCIGDAVGSGGLIEPTSPIFTVLEPIYQANCDKINRADFFVLFGKLVVEKAEPTNTIKLQYQYGRKEVTDCSGYTGRDPDAQLGVDAIKQAFIVQMGLNYVDAGNELLLL